MYDLVVKGGRVVDPASNIDEKLDVAVSGDKIAAIAKNIPEQGSRTVIDATGKMVTPGLIDLHCHVYDVISGFGARPDEAGVFQGVTTVVDGGSAGQQIFGGFSRYIIPSSRTTVLCFVHLMSQGFVLKRALNSWGEIDIDALEAAIEENRDSVKGIKVRINGALVAKSGMKVLEMAKQSAGKFGLPVMVHIGEHSRELAETAMPTRDVLNMMEKGDILSHVYTATYGAALGPDGKVLPELKKAMERGVVMDVAHGKSNLSYAVARKALAEGIVPTTLSTDLSRATITGPVYGMTVTMSKFIALGLSLRQAVGMSTANPARALGIEGRKGSLKPAMDADISILETRSGPWMLEDSLGQAIEAAELLVPSVTVKSGQVVPVRLVAQPEMSGRGTRRQRIEA